MDVRLWSGINIDRDFGCKLNKEGSFSSCRTVHQLITPPAPKFSGCYAEPLLVRASELVLPARWEYDLRWAVAYTCCASPVRYLGAENIHSGLQVFGISMQTGTSLMMIRVHHRSRISALSHDMFYHDRDGHYMFSQPGGNTLALASLAI